MDDFVLLDPDQIKFINQVMDYILRYPMKTVGEIKKKFKLSEDQYQMIMDVTMPHIRAGNVGSYWKNKYTMLRDAISERIRQTKKESRKQLADDIWKIIEETGVGPLNQSAKLDLGEPALEENRKD